MQNQGSVVSPQAGGKENFCLVTPTQCFDHSAIYAKYRGIIEDLWMTLDRSSECESQRRTMEL
jgi:hypothetical protein